MIPPMENFVLRLKVLMIFYIEVVAFYEKGGFFASENLFLDRRLKHLPLFGYFLGAFMIARLLGLQRMVIRENAPHRVVSIVE